MDSSTLRAALQRPKQQNRLASEHSYCSQAPLARLCREFFAKQRQQVPAGAPNGRVDAIVAQLVVWPLQPSHSFGRPPRCPPGHSLAGWPFSWDGRSLAHLFTCSFAPFPRLLAARARATFGPVLATNQIKHLARRWPKSRQELDKGLTGGGCCWNKSSNKWPSVADKWAPICPPPGRQMEATHTVCAGPDARLDEERSEGGLASNHSQSSCPKWCNMA